MKILQPASLALGLLLLGIGHYLGLVWAPPDRMMGDVQRIMYVHVPAAWMALLAYTTTFITSILILARGKNHLDPLASAAAEVGVFFNGLALALGMIWARPTFGVYWSWDPRLTFTLVMFLTYLGYAAVRRFIDDGERRTRFAAAFGVIAWVNLPLVWFSVKWFRSLHQMQSSPATVDPATVLTLRVNAFAFLFLLIWLVWRRYDIARAAVQETALPPA